MNNSDFKVQEISESKYYANAFNRSHLHFIGQSWSALDKTYSFTGYDDITRLRPTFRYPVFNSGNGIDCGIIVFVINNFNYF